MDTLGLIEKAKSLVDTILKAMEEMEQAPMKLQDLLQQVKNGEAMLVRLEGVLVAEAPLKDFIVPPLKQLETELAATASKVGKYRKRAEGKGQWNMVKTGVKTVLGHGAAGQNEQVDKLTKRLQDALVQLDQALNAEIFSKVVMVQNAKNGTRLLRPKVLEKLDQMAIKCLDSEDCIVNVEIGDIEGYDFQHAEAKKPEIPGENDERRAARDGGYELRNSSKVRFEIFVEEDRFFYVVTRDEDVDGSTMLYYPKTTSANNKLNPKFKRIFPDHSKSKHDPLSLRLEKSGDTPIGHQCIYILLTTEKLGDGDLKLEDVENGIEEEHLFVSKFVFDIL